MLNNRLFYCMADQTFCNTLFTMFSLNRVEQQFVLSYFRTQILSHRSSLCSLRQCYLLSMFIVVWIKQIVQLFKNIVFVRHVASLMNMLVPECVKRNKLQKAYVFSRENNASIFEDYFSKQTLQRERFFRTEATARQKTKTKKLSFRKK